jgi:hypothetical protein
MMKTPWKCRLFSHKIVTPKCYNSNPYWTFASFQSVMAVWNGKVYNVKKSWTYYLTIRSKWIVSWFLNLDFMRATIEKICSHYEKKRFFTTSLAIQFNEFATYSCNSLYLYIMSCNGQVAWVVKLQLTVYMMQLIATQSK